VIAVLLASYAALCQTQSATSTSGFEVASIKPSDPAAGGMQIGVSPGGVFTAKRVTVKALIQQAYGIRDFQISGAPGWTDTERYDIIAKGKGTDVSDAEIRKMTDAQRNAFQAEFLVKVQMLLGDRFQLKVHRESKELPVYALVIAKNGPKIRAAEDRDVTRTGLTLRPGDGRNLEITGARMPLGSLARTLSDQAGRTVLDKTGLKGNYDFKMTFTPGMGHLPEPGDGTGTSGADPGRDGPSLFTALQEQLGLRLEAQKGAVEVVVIDHVEKPSAN